MTATPIRFGGVGDHLVLVPVSVEGSGPFDFILDTGAPTSVVDPRFAERVGIKPWKDARAVGAAGATSGSFARIESLQVGEARVGPMSIGIVDKLTSLHPIVPTAVGCLGLDYLRHFVVDVDYARGTIALQNPADTHEPDDAIPFSEHTLLFVQVVVDGEGPFDFSLDTGAKRCVISKDLVASLGLSTQPAPALFGVGGKSSAIDARATRLASLEIGRHRFGDLDVAVSSFFDALRPLTGVPFQGVLGYPIFAGKTVRFDFSRRMLSLQ